MNFEWLSELISANWLKSLIAWLIVWPGGFFVIGIVFESRLIPLWKGQSKAFFPGDLALIVALVTIIGLDVKVPRWAETPLWGYFTMITVLMIAIIIRRNDISNYPARAGRSPTKIVHDIVGYFYIPWLMSMIGIPKLIESPPWNKPTVGWVVFWLALLFYFGCVFYDVANPATPADIKIRHPENWQPLWRTSKK